jgi:very-short-patch-repair endonuclease
MTAACESPIEAAFLMGLEQACRRRGLVLGTDLTVTQQARVGAYRVDFLLEAPSGRRVVVECDGHDFHERTREQASRDKAQDRALQRAGCLIARFTGSDVVRGPERCAIEVLGDLLVV